MFMSSPEGKGVSRPKVTANTSSRHSKPKRHRRDWDKIRQMVATAKPNAPGLAHYRRVQSILEKDAALRKRLGPSVAIERGGNSAKFGKEVVELTHDMHAKGLDVRKLHPKLIQARAVEAIILGKASAGSNEPNAENVEGNEAVSPKQPPPVPTSPASPPTKRQHQSVRVKAKGKAPTGLGKGLAGPLASSDAAIGLGGATKPSQPDIVDLDLAHITTDPAMQCRVALNKQTLADYAERLKAGDQFPPLVVFRIADQQALVDGWHRYEAAKKAGRKSFQAEIRQGPRRDALHFAIPAHRTHGLPLTNKDTRRVVEMALRESPNDSDRAIADLCNVTHPFVSKVRRQLVTVTSCDKRTGRDGKARQMPKRPKTGEAYAAPPDGANPTAKRSDQQTGTPAAMEPEPSSASVDRRSDDSSIADAWVKIEEFLFAQLEDRSKESRKH